MNEKAEKLYNRMLKNSQTTARCLAELLTQKSVLAEVVEKLGVDSSRFERIYKNRFDRFHSQLLTAVEDISPSTAAKLDTRRQEDVLTEDDEPLFRDFF